MHTATFKMHNQQGPTVQYMELCSMLCGSLDGKGVVTLWTVALQAPLSMEFSRQE